MTFITLILTLTCLISVTLVTQEPKLAPEAKVTQLMSRDLTHLPGKEGLTMTCG